MTRLRKPISAVNRALVEGDGLKLHVRDVRLGPRIFHVISPRPGFSAKFATNYFHDTWHIVCDVSGWRLLSRVFGALAVGREENSIFWIGPDLMEPAPFDQEPSRPVVIVPSTVTHIAKDDLKQLIVKLKRTRFPTRTIRWGTPTIKDSRAAEYLERPRYVETNLEGGAVTIRAESSALRALSEYVHPDLGVNMKTTHTYVDDVRGRRWENHNQVDGEVQFYRHFAMISRESAGHRKQILDVNPALKGDALVREIHNSPIRWSLRYP